jgi:hypothetical protein
MGIARRVWSMQGEEPSSYGDIRDDVVVVVRLIERIRQSPEEARRSPCGLRRSEVRVFPDNSFSKTQPMQ